MIPMRIRQLLCRHDYERKGHNVQRTEGIWMCRKCAKEITVESPKRDKPEGVCSVCGKPLTRFEDCCPHHPCSAVKPVK